MAIMIHCFKTKLLAALTLALILTNVLVLLIFNTDRISIVAYLLTVATLFTCAIYIFVSIIRDSR